MWFGVIPSYEYKRYWRVERIRKNKKNEKFPKRATNK
jgi:hypothetical protein